MNKYEEALKNYSCFERDTCKQETIEEEERLYLLKELVERATPKKTLNTKYVLYNEKLVECPICGKNDLKANFCRHCGQALKRSDSNAKEES